MGGLGASASAPIGEPRPDAAASGPADSAAAAPLWLQLLALGAVANVMFLSADLACVALAGAVTDRLRRSGRAQRLVKRAGGAALIGLGANLALQKT